MFCFLASPTKLISLSVSLSLSLSQICGFVNAISPFGNDQQNLMAFRFSASNPILDPWIFIIFRKAVFRHLRAFFRCRFPRDAVKTTAQNALSFPLEGGDPNHSTSIQSQIYCSLPQWDLERAFLDRIFMTLCTKVYQEWRWWDLVKSKKKKTVWMCLRTKNVEKWTTGSDRSFMKWRAKDCKFVNKGLRLSRLFHACKPQHGVIKMTRGLDMQVCVLQ